MSKEEFSVNKAAKNSAIYFFTSILQKALSFFLLPLYTLYLSPEDYGLVSLILSFFGIISLLITLALNGALSRYYFLFKEEPLKQKEFLGTIFSTVLINSALWFVLIFLFQGLISGYFIKDIPFFPYVFLALLSTVSAPVYSLYQTYLQISQNARGFSSNSLAYFAIALVLNLFFIIVLKMGALGFLLTGAITSIIFGCYAVYRVLRKNYAHLVFRYKYFKLAFQYSIPLIPHVLSSTISDYLARNILYLKTTLNSVGLYNIAFQFGSIMDLVISSISNAMLPYIYDTFDNRRENIGYLIKTTTIIFKAVVTIGICIAVFSRELVELMTSDMVYFQSWKAIPIITLSSLFSFMYGTYVTLLFYSVKGTRFIWVASITGNLLNIAFMIYFATRFDYLAPAIALVVQRFVMFIIVYFISRKYEKVAFELFTMLFIILFYSIIVVIGILPDILFQPSGLNLPVLGWKLMIVILTWFILLHNNRKMLFSFLSKNFGGLQAKLRGIKQNESLKKI